MADRLTIENAAREVSRLRALAGRLRAGTATQADLRDAANEVEHVAAAVGAELVAATNREGK